MRGEKLMSHIVLIEFRKSRSRKFKKILSMSKKLPGFDNTNGRYTIQIDTRWDYLKNQEMLLEIIRTVHKWKGTSIFYMVFNIPEQRILVFFLIN